METQISQEAAAAAISISSSTITTTSIPKKPNNNNTNTNNNNVLNLKDLISVNYLARIHAGCFTISLSLGYQALLWKILLNPHTHSRITISVPAFLYSTVLTVLWSFSLLVLVLLSLAYALNCIFSSHLIKAEFTHHVSVNYLFAPWISWLLVLESAPFVNPVTRRNASVIFFWWLFAIPVLVLDVKIYGQWFIKGKHVLTAVANPTSLLSVIGNLIGARAAAKMGWREVSVFLFSLGMVHYLVLFVTLYQRLSGGDRLPSMLRPAFSLFFAAPSVASLAWYSIDGSFDTVAKMLFYLSLFIFASLMCRPLIFKKAMKKFSIAWWAYSYPITMLALTSTRYEQEVPGGFPRVIRLLLSGLSVFVLLALLVFSAVKPKSLFPRDDHPSVLLQLPTHHPTPTPTPTPSTTT